MQKQWYALRTHVGYEHRIKTALQKKIYEHGQEAVFGEIVVPTEKVIDLVRGKKQTVERRLFPGYVFVEMVFSQAAWHLVHAVPKVVGFVGEADTAPTPIPLPSSPASSSTNSTSATTWRLSPPAASNASSRRQATWRRSRPPSLNAE